MSSNRLFNSCKFNRVVLLALIVWIASAAVSMYLLTRFDSLVHGELYNYGLQFDHAWADVYYSYSQLMYIALGVPIALSFVAILIGFKTVTEKNPLEPKLKPKLVQPQPVVRPQQQPMTRQEQKAPVKVQVRENTNITGVTCPSCKKVFGRPLVMLNFESGKNRLVNVCPYCSYVLGNAENKQSSKLDFRVADSDKKVTH